MPKSEYIALLKRDVQFYSKAWPTRVSLIPCGSVKPGDPLAARGADVHPDPNSPAYRATEFRHPKQPLIIIPQTLTELSAARVR
jgi:hypothetical protein